MSIVLSTIPPLGAASITLKQPYFGYSTIIKMNLHYSRTQAGYKIGDDGATYDIRMCDIPTWMLDATDQAELEEFFNNVLKGRGNNFTLELGTSSGFFPFGMDKGDSSNFVCSLLLHDREGIQLNPYLQHLNKITLVYVSGPSVAYTPPSVETEGTLSIGTVTTLRPVQTFPKVTQELSIIREVSRGGVVSSVDLGSTGDLVESVIDLDMRPGNCAALITYLLTARSGDITIVAPLNTWLFDASSGTYTTKLLTNEISITHERFNLFKTSLKFWKKA